MRIFLFIIIFFPLILQAQVKDTSALKTTDLGRLEKGVAPIALDSTKLQANIDSALSEQPKKKRFLKKFLEDYPNPKKALISGLIIPGGGQIYNGALWKAPLVYGAYGTVITLITTNKRQHEYFSIQYSNWVNNTRLDNPDLPVDDLITSNFTQPSQVREIRDQYLKSKEFSWIALFGVTLLSVADAFVDCHLKDFDISDDLSLEWKPALLNTPGWGNVAGVGVVIPLNVK